MQNLDTEKYMNKKQKPTAVPGVLRVIQKSQKLTSFVKRAKWEYILTCKPALVSPQGSSSWSVQPFGISGPHWKKKSCLRPHIKYTNTNKKSGGKKRVSSKFMILCWASFIAVLGHIRLAGCMLDTPARAWFALQCFPTTVQPSVSLCLSFSCWPTGCLREGLTT